MTGGAAYDDLGSLYDVWCSEVVEDIPFWVGLVGALAHEVRRTNLDVLELGAGSGRISLPLAHAGHRVTGIDLSTVQLETLRARAREAGLDGLVTTHLGDMRELDALVTPASFDVALVPFRGLLHVTGERDSVLAAAARALRPGGVLAFDVFHPDDRQVAAAHDRWLKRRVEPTAHGQWRFDERGRYGVVAGSDERTLDVDVRARWTPTRRGKPNRGAELADPADGESHERTALLQLQLAPATAWLASLVAAGLEVDGAYGWFDARPLADDDDDSIWVARAPR
ncbi:MAG: class I SAM-dependent methyltransferase [Thermoleophilia bacterium]|nr:class I SAM-dependent methyltransferase [Thermoleophilia bacterium]